MENNIAFLYKGEGPEAAKHGLHFLTCADALRWARKIGLVPDRFIDLRTGETWPVRFWDLDKTRFPND